MQTPVCTLPAPKARHPEPNPELCPCGEPLTLEMERDVALCVDCQAEAAGMGGEA